MIHSAKAYMCRLLYTWPDRVGHVLQQDDPEKHGDAGQAQSFFFVSTLFDVVAVFVSASGSSSSSSWLMSVPVSSESQPSESSSSDSSSSLSSSSTCSHMLVGHVHGHTLLTHCSRPHQHMHYRAGCSSGTAHHSDPLPSPEHAP